MNQKLIKDLKEGRIAIQYKPESDTESLRRVVSEAFPNDGDTATMYGAHDYYYASRKAGHWVCANCVSLPTVKLEDFFKTEIPEFWCVNTKAEHQHLSLFKTWFERESGSPGWFFREKEYAGYVGGCVYNGFDIGPTWNHLGNTPTEISLDDWYENIYNKKAETKEMKKEFVITEEQARKIIKIACSSWQPKLVKKWSEEILLKEQVTITEEFYKKMRAACTEPQHRLFDEIFGSREAICSYKDGEPILVGSSRDSSWFIRIATGKFVDGEVETYINQESSGEDKTTWQYHKPSKNFSIPRIRHASPLRQ